MTVTRDNVVLPKVVWDPTAASGNRYGHPIELVVNHTWGDRFSTEQQELATYEGVINFFKVKANEASSHFVQPGSAKPGEITQMVAYADYAWTEAAFNPIAVEIESADLIWNEQDEAGLLELARIDAFLLHHFKLPPVWSTRKGFCRHGDLGAAGGGHTACPTTNMALWRKFVGMVQYQYHRGGFEPVFGR